MISYDRIIAEMDRQLAVARHANDEGAMREALSAVRSLCEVALDQKGFESTGLKRTGFESTGFVNSARPTEKIIPQLLRTPEVQSLSSVEGKPLEEIDANGGSLFEF